MLKIISSAYCEKDKMLKGPQAGSAGLGDESKDPTGLRDGIEVFKVRLG